MNVKQNFELRTKPNITNRIVAGFVDYLIIFAFTYIYILMVGEPNDDGEYKVNGLPAFVPMLFWLLMTVGFEQFFGATLGNSLVGLKPISIKKLFKGATSRIEDLNLTFGQSLKRHLLDIPDMFFFGLIGIVTIKNTENNQRLGDIWAKTVVVKMSELNELW